MIGVNGSFFSSWVFLRGVRRSLTCRRGWPTSLLLRLTVMRGFSSGGFTEPSCFVLLNKLKRFFWGFFEEASLELRVREAFPRDFLDGNELNLSSLPPLILLLRDRARSKRSACASTNSASLRRASADKFWGSLRTFELVGKVRGSERDPLDVKLASLNH